jgi:hypothetical protein
MDFNEIINSYLEEGYTEEQIREAFSNNLESATSKNWYADTKFNGDAIYSLKCYIAKIYQEAKAKDTKIEFSEKDLNDFTDLADEAVRSTLLTYHRLSNSDLATSLRELENLLFH